MNKIKYIKNIELMIIGIFSIFFIPTIILSLLYPQYFMGIAPMLVNIFFIFLFVIFFKFLYRKSYKLEFRPFLFLLFRYSIFLCLFYIVLQYILSYVYTPEKFPYDIGIIDNYFYNKNGLLSKSIFEGKSNYSKLLNEIHYSDTGYPLVVGFFYYIFGDYQLPLKLMSALSVAISSVCIAKATREFVNERIAKLTGIIYAIIPTVGYLSGFFLKESFMMMIVSIALYFIAKTLKSFSFINIAMAFICIVLLFYFRPYVAVCVMISFFVANMFQYKKGIYSLLSVVAFVLIAITLMRTPIMEPFQADLEKEYLQLTAKDQYFAKKTKTVGDLSKIGMAPLLVLSPIFPLPSITDLRSSTDIESLGVLYRIHIDIVRIVLLFWAYLGIYNIIKKRQIKHFYIFLVPLLVFIIINSIIAVLTYYRYQYVTLLFLSPFIACGITSFYCNYKRNVKLYTLYVILIIILIIVYNIIRIQYK